MAEKYKFDLLLSPTTSHDALKYIQKLYDLSVPCFANPQLFPDDYCRVWTRAKTKDGYAKHRVPSNLSNLSKSTLVHKFIWECFEGKTGVSSKGEELTIDHKCGRTDCINLRHLHLLPRSLNENLGDRRKLYEKQAS